MDDTKTIIIIVIIIIININLLFLYRYENHRGLPCISRCSSTKARLRGSIKRADPVGQRLRSINPIRRRVYNVRSPLSLWHMDGNHKLIRFPFVHGIFCIIIYKCSAIEHFVMLHLAIISLGGN